MQKRKLRAETGTNANFGPPSLKKALDSIPVDDAMQAGLKAIEDFREMTLEQFLDLPPQERGFTGGAIMGNYSAHHPAEAFALLKTIFANARNKLEKDP